MAKLGEICDVRDGTHDSPEYLEFGFPLVTSKNICDGRIDFSTTNYISEKDYLKICERSKVDVGDILMPMIGTIGNPVIVNCNIEFAIKNVSLIKFVSDSIYNRFVLYLLESDCFQRYISEKNRGGTQKFLSLGDIRNFEFTLPSFSVQKQIASTLDKVTDLINKRKQQLEKLDELVKSRFVELFGEPVTNEKNWPRLTLGDICEIGSSKRVFEKDYVPSGIPFFRTKEIVELSKGNPISTELFITEEHFAELKKTYGAPQKDDLLISAVGTIGTIWIVNGDFEFYFKDGNLIQIKSSPTFNSIFMKYLLDELIANYKKEMSTGTAYSALTIAGLKKMLVYDVPLECQKHFAAFAEQTDKLKFEAKQGLEKLETLKKALMQEYFG